MSWIDRLAAAAAALLLCNAALADCEMRKMTAKEREYDRRVSAALLEAIGPAPAGWTRTLQRAGESDEICGERKDQPFEVSVGARYQFQPSKEDLAKADAEDRKLAKEIDNLRDLPPEVKKERQVWLDKMSEANRASRAAEKAGNKTLAREKDREAEGYSQKGREVRDRYWVSIRPKVEALEARRRAGGLHAAVNVKLVANPDESTRRGPGPGEDFIVGARPKGKSGLKVEGVLVVFESTGVEARRKEVVAAIDREKLKRLLQ